MKKILFLLLISVFSCKENTAKTDTADKTSSSESKSLKASENISNTDYELEVYDYDGLKPLINKDDEKLHVVNFWATWCAPCVKELPYFEALNDKYSNNEVEVLLVSLDFPSKYDSALKPYIKKNNLKSKVVALNDTDQNRWIPAINENWSGAIPATIIYKGDERKFYEQSFTKEELQTEINKFLK